MAKYEIKCSKCGKTYVKELFGKQSDRANKIAWLEENGTCIDCYHKEQNKKPFVVITTKYLASGKEVFAVTEGNTYAIKEDLKQAGFFWGEYLDNNSRVRKAWMTSDKTNLGKVGLSYKEV